MTTIEERREIAERLRMRLANWSGMGWRIHIPEIGNGVWMENHGGNDELEEAAKRLADLIEPSDRDALLELADEMGRIRNRCDFCNKKGDCDWADESMCLEDRMEEYAEIIEEAVGA